MSGGLASLLRGTLYVQLSAAQLKVRDAKKGREIAEPPEMAIAREKGKERIVGLGHDARTPRPYGVHVVNPFAHPRTPISDFTVAEQLLRGFIRRLVGRAVFAPSPRIVMHPLGDFEGGLTQVELRALRELAMGAGASEVVVWIGPPLTDEQLLAPELPGTGRVLT